MITYDTNFGRVNQSYNGIRSTGLNPNLFPEGTGPEEIQYGGVSKRTVSL